MTTRRNTQTHKPSFNKTLAIALAAGLSFSGVQVVGPELGISVAGEASAADLQHSALTNITLKSKKTGDDLFNQPEPKTTQKAEKFERNQGKEYILGLDFKIPDSAQPGDSMYIGFNTNIHTKGLSGNITAPTEEGRKVGYLDANLNYVKFVVSDDVADAQKREAHFEVPVKVENLSYAPSTKDDTDVGKNHFNYVRLVNRTGDVITEWKSTTQSIKNTTVSKYYVDPDHNDQSLVWDWRNVKLNEGTSIYDNWSISIGMANVKYSNKFLDGTEEGILKTKATLDPAATGSRNVTIRYQSDDPDSRIIYTGAENGKNTLKGRTHKFSSDPVKSTIEKNSYKFYTDEGVKDYKSTFKRIDNQTVELTIHDVPVDISVDFYSPGIPFYGESPYEPGKTVTMTGTFVNGVGDPASAFDRMYSESSKGDITMPSFDGYGSAEDIHRTATMTATVNDKDANSKNEAVTISSGGTGHFKINIKNTGNIGVSSAVIKFPKGVTDAENKTERAVKFPGGLASGKDKNIDLGDLKVADGTQENKFTVEMAGFETMSDPAWTNTTKSAENFDPNWDNTEVPDGGSIDITPTNTKDIPQDTKYTLTGDHPQWITINPNTGIITAKPPQGEDPAPHKVTITTTYPDGSTDTDTPTITVTHDDVYIDGKPDVKPDGTVTLHRNDGEDITFKVPTGSTVDVNKDGDLVITQPDGTTKTVPLKHTTITEQGEPGTPNHKIIITDENGNTHEFGTYDKYLESIDDDGKGTYTFIMNDGTKLGPIQLGDDIVKITDDGNGNLVITHKDGSTDTVPLKHTTIVESGTPGDKDYSVTITTPDGKTITLDAYDNYIQSIEKQDNGDYLVKRNDGTEWTIELSDIRQDIADLKGKDTEQDKRLDDLENRIDSIDTEITNLGNRITHNENAIENHAKALGDLTKEVDSINTELGDIKTELDHLNEQDIKEVHDNGDGTYTLIRNNGDEVTGIIDTSGTITSIVDNGDGTITLTKTDGSTENVKLSHTKVETSGQPGDTDYTITITTPNGDSITINAFDVYVTDVIRNDEGNYDIFRSDVDGGKTVWKTIILSDIRDQIAHLEDRADQLENKDEDLQRQIDELKKYLDATEQEIQALKNRTTNLEKAVTAINAQLDVIKLTITALDTRIAALEGRVTTVEDTQRAWAQCYNGIKGAALPLLAILPLLAASNAQIPGVAEWNNNIQRTLGIYNKDLSRMASQYSGIAGVVATVLGVLGAIGLYNHAATACEPYSQATTGE